LQGLFLAYDWGNVADPWFGPWVPTARGKYFTQVFTGNWLKNEYFETLIGFLMLLVQKL